MAKRPSKIKQNFWFLTAFFVFFTVICLAFMWTGPSRSTHSSAMMGTTMGNMLRNEVGPFTLADLFKPGEFVKNDMSSHHQGSTLIANLHFCTTAVIVMLLPLIVGGLLFLLTIWF